MSNNIKKVHHYNIVSPSKPNFNNFNSSLIGKDITSTPIQKGDYSDVSSNFSYHSTENSFNDTIQFNRERLEMASVEELAQQIKDLQALVAAKPNAAQRCPIRKGGSVDFKKLKDSSYVFPQKFSNLNDQIANNHINEFECWCESAAIESEEEKVQWFKLTITGDVKTWYDQTDFYNFEDLNQKFKQNFGEYRSDEEARIAFNKLSLKSGEKAHNYCRRIKTLANIAKMSEADIKDQFFRGLGTQFACVKQVRSLYPLDQCCAYLQNVIDNQEDKQVHFQEESVHAISSDRGRQKQRKDMKSRNSYTSRSKDRSTSNSSYFSDHSRSSSRHNSRSRSRNSSKKHPAARSPTPKSFNCHNCGGRGHFAKECPSSKQQPKYDSKSSSRNRSGSRQRSTSRNNYYVIKEEKKFSGCTYKEMVDYNGKTVLVKIPAKTPDVKEDLN